ncbi:MAG: glycoside hydrolase family 2 [Clostridia bacterium]|nr:glycoside hydrolase family 2 [Clostridia bacterium]
MNWINDYPRPQLKRDSFFSLNGEWTMNGRPLKVPFPPQSRLSGWKGDVPETLEYSRSFTLPAGFNQPGRRVRLHFGAVDQVAEVHVNDHSVARHEGGYLPFHADVTDVLKPGENIVSVRAIDTLSPVYPYGKQTKKRGGMWYTPVSGIWQSVWLESVPEEPIESLKIVPDLTGITLTVFCDADTCRIEIPGEADQVVGCRKPVRIAVKNPKLWTPDNPHLYPLIVSTEADRVESYFALRTVVISEVKGVPRVLLNGEPLFLNGVLDQGYFQDGLFLPSSPDGYEKDILRMKELGVNLLRKHIKIEPEAFYHACDRLGMLVMQDMVNSGPYSFFRDTALPTVGLIRRSDRCAHPERDLRMSFFTYHAMETVTHLFNHPSIITWTIFNEGWGQFNADEHYDMIRGADPTRFIDSTSGWFHQKYSDVDSRHIYFRNKTIKRKDRPVFLSECGGYTRPIKGHQFNPQAQYGYGATDSEEALTAKIELMWEKMVLPAVADGLCGLVYTQVSDVEDEINGLYTYDREICKVNKERMRALAERAHAILKNI